MPPATNVRSIVPYIGSMNFDGVDDACTIPDSAIPASAFQNGFVLFARIIPRGAGGGGGGNILSKNTGTGGNGGFHFSTGSAETVWMRVANGAIVSSGDGSTRSRNRWNHVMAHVSANGTISFYIDGVLTGTPAISNAPSAITTTNPLTVGNRSSATDRAFDGRMAQVGILSLAGRGDLTQDEITALYLHNVIPAGTKLLHLETTANQIKGNQWLDKSGNNNHATIVGPTFSYEKPSARVAQIGAPVRLDGAYDGVVSGGVTIAGGAMVFDGVSGWVNPPVISQISKSKPFSISVWFMKTSGIRLLSHALADADRFGISFVGDEIRVGIYNGVSYFVSKSGNTLSGQMNCLVVTFDGASNLRAYVNNVEITNVNGPSASGALFEIGKQSSSYFAGQIPQLTVFNRSLTADERTAIFNAGKDAVCPVKRGLVAEWSGRDWEGPAATPTKVFDVASWDGLNVLT